MPSYPTLVFTTDFFDSYADRKLTAADRAAILKALANLDRDENHPSLKTHPLRGEFQGLLSAYASRSLRLRFRRMADGRKELVDCRKHHDD